MDRDLIWRVEPASGGSGDGWIYLVLQNLRFRTATWVFGVANCVSLVYGKSRAALCAGVLPDNPGDGCGGTLFGRRESAGAEEQATPVGGNCSVSFRSNEAYG